MKTKIKFLLENKALTMPILSFPSTQLIGCTVQELVTNSDKQAKGMAAIMARCPLSASLNMMDLSVEAEAFGAAIKYETNEIPTVTRGIIDNIEDSDKIITPKVGDGRTGIYIDGVRKAKRAMPSKLIMCGVIGPFSLAGRLYDMTELMMACYDDGDCAETLLNKTTAFITEYIMAFKQAGADGVIIAEPAAGLLSPSLCEEFSSKYVKRIIDTVSSDDFVIVYHNCGNTIPLVQSIVGVGADVYHYGNAINMEAMLQLMPKDKVVMGNINPVDFKTSTPDIIYKNTMDLLRSCGKYENFIISSGCDIPAESKWDNIDSYFKAVSDYYGGKI